MSKQDRIENLTKLIKDLEAEKSSLEEQINCAKVLLSSMTGQKIAAATSLGIIGNNPKSKKLSESTKEKMRIAQQKRQEREQHFKLIKIQDFLKENDKATTKEVAEFMQLTEYVVKKYMRSEDSHCEEFRPDIWRYVVWTYLIYPFISANRLFIYILLESWIQNERMHCWYKYVFLWV